MVNVSTTVNIDVKELLNEEEIKEVALEAIQSLLKEELTNNDVRQSVIHKMAHRSAMRLSGGHIELEKLENDFFDRVSEFLQRVDIDNYGSYSFKRFRNDVINEAYNKHREVLVDRVTNLIDDKDLNEIFEDIPAVIETAIYDMFYDKFKRKD